MHTHESTLYTQHASCIHTSAAAPSNGHELADRSLARGECRRSQLHSARRQPTIASEHLEVRGVDLVLHHCARLLVWSAIGQRSTCLHGTGSTESVPHTGTHSRTSGTSKVVCHALVVASPRSWSIACVSDALTICMQCGDTFDICMQCVHMTTHTFKLGTNMKAKAQSAALIRLRP
jgi:hypothetical protein